MIPRIAQQTHYAARSLAKSPGFTLVTIAILILGIGANATVFTLVSRLVLQSPEGIGEPEQLVRAIRFSKNRPAEWWSYPDYLFFRDHNRIFQGLAAYFPVPVVLMASTGRQSIRVEAMLVAPNYFDVLAVRPRVGRAFLKEEGGSVGGPAVAVLSHRFWKHFFGGSQSSIGALLRLNGHPFTVVGVAPAEFRGASPVEFAPDLWVPLTVRPVLMPETGPGWFDRVERKEVTWLQLIGRLPPDVSPSRAQANLDVLARDFSREYATPDREGQGVRLSPSFHLRPEVHDELIRLARLLMGAVALVLLIASTNVAILLLARTLARRKDFGIQLSLGARRGQIAGQLMAEGMVLALAGAVGGFLLAFWSAELASRLMPFEFIVGFSPDTRVLAFTFAVATASAVLSAGAPAIRAARTDVAALIKTGDLGSGRSRLLEVLVVVQVALSIILVTGAALFLRSLRAAEAVDLGFETENRLLVSVDLSQYGYLKKSYIRFVDEALERLSSLPDARRVSTMLFAPFGGMWSTYVKTTAGQRIGASLNAVGPHYFEASGIPLLAGRGFTDRDRDGASLVAIVNEAAAEDLWPGSNPLGETLDLEDGAPATVVGIARNVHYHELGEAPVPHIYLPTLQVDRRKIIFLIESAGDPLKLIAPIEREIRSIDPQVPIAKSQTMKEAVEMVLGRYRVGATLMTLVAVLALILAAVGLYGVLSYLVVQQRRAIGIQMALGATAARVVGSVLARSCSLTILGSAIGLAAAWAASRFIGSFLFGIHPRDPVSFLLVPLVLGMVTCIASSLPAYRAARVDPVEVLR